MSDLTQKIQINVKIDEYLFIDYEKLENIIDELTAAKTKYEGLGYTNLSIRFIRDCGCRHDCSCDPSPCLYGNRIETEAEYQKRIKDIQTRAAASEKYEREQLIKLKKKYGV
jgi:hypothetical protein